MIDPAKLAAHVDGELDAAGRAEVELALAGDGEVAGQLARHRDLRDSVRQAFAETLDEPSPQFLIDAVLASSTGYSRPAAPAPWLVAASLAFDLVVGSSLHFGQAPLVVSVEGDGAPLALASALETQAS